MSRWSFQFKAKKKGVMNMTNKTRHVRLQNYHICIYHKEDDAAPSSVISLMEAKFSPSSDVQNAIELKFQDNKRNIYQLGSDEVIKAIRWMRQAREAAIQRFEKQEQEKDEEDDVVARAQGPHRNNNVAEAVSSPKDSPVESMSSPSSAPMSPPAQSQTPPMRPLNGGPFIARTLRKVDVRVGNHWMELPPNSMVEIAKRERVVANNGNQAFSYRLTSPYKGVAIEEREALFKIISRAERPERSPKLHLNCDLPLNQFARPFKPGKHATQITYWGKDHGSKKSRKIKEPLKISALTDLKLVSLSLPKEATHGFAINQKCSLYVFGETGAHPSCNPLGLGQTLNAYRPLQIPSLKNTEIVQVCGSEMHTLALERKGIVYGWGKSTLTSLSANSSTPQRIPLEMVEGRPAGIAACNSHSALWTQEGLLYTWGKRGPWLGYDWQHAYARGRTHPMGEVRFPDLRSRHTIQKVTVSTTHTIVLFRNGIVATFGVNTHGQLGTGDNRNCLVPFHPPIPACGDIACGTNFSIFLTQEGQILSCGSAYHGHPFADDLYSPRRIESLTAAKFVRVHAGNDCVYAITARGCVVMWGRYSGTGDLVKQPKVIQILRQWRTYHIGVGADFSMSLAVRVNRHIETGGLPVDQEEQMHFLRNHSVPPHPPANQASVVNSSMSNSSTSPNKKLASQSRSRFSRSPSHPVPQRMRPRHQSSSPTRRRIRRVSASPNHTRGSPAPNHQYQRKFRASVSPNGKRRLPQKPIATPVVPQRPNPSKSPFNRRHTVGVSIQSHESGAVSSPNMHLSPKSPPARPNQNIPPTVGTYSRISRSRTPGADSTRYLIRRRKSEHRDPRTEASKQEEPVRNVSYSDDEEEHDETSENIYGRGSFDFTLPEGTVHQRRDTAYSEVSNTTSSLKSPRGPLRGRADTTYSQVSNFGKSHSETRAEYLFPAEVAEVKSQSVSFMDQIEFHHPPNIHEVKKNDPSASKTKTPPPAPPSVVANASVPPKFTGGGALPPEPKVSLEAPKVKTPPPTPPDIGGAKTPPPTPPQLMAVSSKTPPPQPIDVRRSPNLPPAQPDVIKKKSPRPIDVHVKRMPIKQGNDPNSVKTPPPPPPAAVKRTRWNEPPPAQTSPKELPREQPLSSPDDAPPAFNPAMNRHKSAPASRKVRVTSPVSRNRWRRSRRSAEEVDLSKAPPPPVAPSMRGSPSPNPRKSLPAMRKIQTSPMLSRHSSEKRTPSTKRKAMSPPVTVKRGRARKKHHYAPPPAVVKARGRYHEQANTEYFPEEKKELKPPPMLSSAFPEELKAQPTPPPQRRQENASTSSRSRIRANTRIEEVLDAVED